MENRRPCKKCLLAQLDNDKLLADVRTAVERLPKSERAGEAVYSKRLSVCLLCDHLNEGTCNACGCYVELRAAAVSGKCPYGRWDKEVRS